MLKPTIAITIAVFLAVTSYGQERPKRDPFAGMGIPIKLQASAKKRLQMFLDSQRDGQWDTVNSMLGLYIVRPYEQNERKKYSLEQKAAGLSELQKQPLVNIAIEYIHFTTWILSRPLNKRQWEIHGCGKFQTQDGTTDYKISLTIYRDRNEWFFTPIFWRSETDQKPVRCGASSKQ